MSGLPFEGAGDEAIAATNDDATSCKRFATEKGYWKDDFVKCFCKTAVRKSPEINRGYYARVTAVRSVLRQFMEVVRRTSGARSQVVTLGAGFDTTYWCLRATGSLPDVYYEVDLPAVCAKKCHVIRNKKELLEGLQESDELSITSSEIHSAKYHLIPADLRNTESLEQKLLSSGLDMMSPTLFIAECVLVYIEPHLSAKLINWIGKRFPTAMILNYEPFNAHDQFGLVMKENIKARGCSLLGIDACPDLESQRQRYLQNNWTSTWAVSMADYYRMIPADEISRIEKLEFLDEGGLLTQLLQHYCVSAGYNDKNNIGLSTVGLQLR